MSTTSDGPVIPSDEASAGETDEPVPEERRPRGRLLAGRYRLGKRIGAGGMGTILAAHDQQMDRRVAVKVMHAHLADDAEVRRRFADEARHAASLSHPNVVAVYDQGAADLPYIVMERVDGPTLRDVLGTHGPLEPAQVIAAIAPLCDALDASHAMGLVHRDIKPENILLSSEGLPKLADFGIARVMAATSHTATGTLVGSVHYLAPELVDGIEATPASDQYALAVVAFELLTGRKPLPAGTPMAIALRHANEDVPAPSIYAPEVPPSLDRVVLRATARRPGDRYPSMAAFGRVLLDAVDDGSEGLIVTGDDGLQHTLLLPLDAQQTIRLQDATPEPEAPGQQPADHPARRITTPALGEARPSSRPAAPASRSRSAPAAEPPRRRRGLIALLVVLVLGVLGGGAALVWDQVLAPVADIPDVVGAPRAEAFAALDALDLAMRVTAEEHDLDVAEGVVLSQRPSSGGQLRAGGTVEVVLSLGPRIVPMPALVGVDEADLAAALAGDSLAAAIMRAHHDTVPEGTILSQEPAAGSDIPQGSDTVVVTVSLGIEQVRVPDLAGLDEQGALDALAAAQLSGNVSRAYSDAVPEAGGVVSQAVAPDAEVDKFTAIDIVISRGPQTIETPDVRGMTVAEARAALEAVGLVVDEASDEVPTLGPFTFGEPGIVMEQSPGPGAEIRRGDTVTIFYFV